MRLYHKYYRIKNPKNRRRLCGIRGDVNSILLRSLDDSELRSNPGEMIDSFNLLGRLNRQIDEGHSELIPLRDTVSARIEGHLSEDALRYSIPEALKNLSSAQVRVVRQMIDEAGGEVTPRERKAIDIASARHPSVRRAVKHLDAAEQYEELFRSSLERKRLKNIEFLVGPERLSAMKGQDLAAKKEIGTERYRPSDVKLWKKVEADLEKKYPKRFVPVKLASVRALELENLVKMSHVDTPKAEKDRIKKRLQTALANRWRTAMILEYERRGGEELSPKEAKLRGRQKMKALGTPFPVGPGFLGVILGPRKGEAGFRWILFDDGKYVYMRGSSSTKGSASRDVGIAYRVLGNLANLGDYAGWDNLATADRRWLDGKRPELSARVARILTQNISPSKVSKGTAVWIMSSADIPRVEVEDDGSMPQVCKKMTLNEERAFSGQKGEYTIHVKKGRAGKFTFYVETKNGEKSQPRRTSDCDEIAQRGHAIGGAMVGATRVARAIRNPEKLKRLQSSAEKYFRKRNPSSVGTPKMPRQPAEEGDIRDLAGMVGIPANPEDAYRYGFYAGIIRGIDTCGVQNYFKRKRIKNIFQERLMSAALETTAQVTGTSVKPVSKRRKRYSSTTQSDIDDDMQAILDSM